MILTDELIEKYHDEIEAGIVRIEFRLYSGNSFITDFDITNARTVLDSYSHLPDLTIESWLHGIPESEVCDQAGHPETSGG
jgi:hypothetical protein